MNCFRKIVVLLLVLTAAGTTACSTAPNEAEMPVPSREENESTGNLSTSPSPSPARQTGKTDVGIVVEDADGAIDLDLSDTIFVSTSGNSPGVRAKITCDGSSYGIVSEGWGLGHGITKYALGGPTAQQDLPIGMVSAYLPDDVIVTEKLDTILTSDYALGLSILVQPNGEDVTCDVYVTDLSNGNVLVDETVTDGPRDGIAYVMYQPGMD